MKCINKKELTLAKTIKIFDATDKKVTVNLNTLIFYKQPQICINDERLFENPSKPSFSETISDNQELTSIETKQPLPSVKNISDLFPDLNFNIQNLQILRRTVANLNS